MCLVFFLFDFFNQPGDVLKIVNLHVNVVSNQVEMTLHRGNSFNRGIHKLPKFNTDSKKLLESLKFLLKHHDGNADTNRSSLKRSCNDDNDENGLSTSSMQVNRSKMPRNEESQNTNNSFAIEMALAKGFGRSVFPPVDQSQDDRRLVEMFLRTNTKDNTSSPSDKVIDCPGLSKEKSRLVTSNDACKQQQQLPEELLLAKDRESHIPESGSKSQEEAGGSIKGDALETSIGQSKREARISVQIPTISTRGSCQRSQFESKTLGEPAQEDSSDKSLVLRHRNRSKCSGSNQKETMDKGKATSWQRSKYSTRLVKDNASKESTSCSDDSSPSIWVSLYDTQREKPKSSVDELDDSAPSTSQALSSPEFSGMSLCGPSKRGKGLSQRNISKQVITDNNADEVSSQESFTTALDSLSPIRCLRSQSKLQTSDNDKLCSSQQTSCPLKITKKNSTSSRTSTQISANIKHSDRSSQKLKMTARKSTLSKSVTVPNAWREEEEEIEDALEPGEEENKGEKNDSISSSLDRVKEISKHSEEQFDSEVSSSTEPQSQDSHQPLIPVESEDGQDGSDDDEGEQEEPLLCMLETATGRN